MKNQFEIRGESVAVLLPRRDRSHFETYIDLADLPTVLAFPVTWCASWDRESKTYYVKAHIPGSGRNRRTIPLHRFLLGPPRNTYVDHIDHNGLNNRRSNLRITTNAGNQQNRRIRQSNNTTSGFRGVTWHKATQRWRVRIKLRGKEIWIGHYRSLGDAIAAAREARRRLMPLATG